MPDFSKLSDAELQALASGGQPKASADDQFSKLSDDELQALASGGPQPKADLANKAYAGASSLADNISLGLYKPYASAVRSVTGQGIKAVQQGDIHQLDWQHLKNAYNADVAFENKTRDDNPVPVAVGQVGAAFVPWSVENQLISSAQKSVAPLAQGVENFAANKGLANGVTNFGGRVARSYAEGALGAGAITAGQNAVRNATGYQDPSQNPSVLDSMKYGGAVNSVLTAAPDLAKGAAKSLGWVGKKTMSTFLGPSVEALEARMGAGGEQIASARSTEKIKDGIDNVMSSFLGAVDTAKMTHAEAKDALREVNQKVRDATQQANFDFRVSHADIDAQLRQAEDALDRSFGVEKEKLAAIKSPIHIADDVQSAMSDLRQQVSDGSKKSYEILGDQKGRVGISPVLDQIEQMKEALHTGEGANKALLSEDAGKAHAALEKWSTKLSAVADEDGAVSYPTLKKIVQEIDSDMGRYGNKMNPAEYSGQAEQSMFGLRKSIDSNLKEIPEYKKVMSDVAEKTKLLSEAGDRFSDPRATVSRLNSIGGRNAGEDRDLLQRLGEATKKDFVTPVDQYVNAQSTLKNPSAMENIRQSLPEYKAARMSQLEKEGLARPEAKVGFVDEQLAKSGLPEKQAAAESAVNEAKSAVDKAQEKVEPFRNLTPQGSQKAINSVMKPEGKENIEVRRQLEKLSDVSGQDFLKWIDQRRMANQFEGEYRQGSRNVNIGRAIGAGVGGFLGNVPGLAVGGAVGGSAGAFVDRYGPTIAGKISDAVRGARGPEIMDAIQNLSIPQQAKTAAIRELQSFSAQGASTPLKAVASKELDKDSSTSAQTKVPSKGPDKWASDGFNNLEKHGLSGLDRDSMMKDPKMKDLLIQASDLKPGSKAMKDLADKINKAKGGK